MKQGTLDAALIGGGLLIVGLAVLAWRHNGGLAGAAQSIGSGAVNAAGAVTTGAVGAVGAAVGLPTPGDTTQDPATARWIADNYGWFEASRWSSAGALAHAAFLSSTDGTPPPAGSPFSVAHGLSSASDPSSAAISYQLGGTTSTGSGSFNEPIDFGTGSGW